MRCWTRSAHLRSSGPADKTSEGAPPHLQRLVLGKKGQIDTHQILGYTPEDVRSDHGEVAACIHILVMDSSRDYQAVATTMNGACLKNVKFARACR